MSTTRPVRLPSGALSATAPGRAFPLVLALVLGLVLLVTPPAGADHGGSVRQGGGPGPAPGQPPTALTGEGGPAEPLKGLAVLDRTERGYRFRAGQQDSDLRVSLLGGRLVIADRGTAAWRGLPAGCRRLSPPVGIAAACPARSRQREVFLEIWPRLGDDVVDTTALPARYRAWVLTDDGDDVVRTGAGDDFVNGAQGDDVVDTGSGQDWVRGGIGANTIAGGEDGDRLVGGEDVDVLDGGAGDDVLFGAGGADELTGADGADLLVGEDGPDTARADDHDVVRTCERIVADEAATPAPRGAPRRIARADLR